MNKLIKVALASALICVGGAGIAGEISNTTVDVAGVENLTNSTYNFAWQDVGVATGSGRILNSSIHAQGARNHAASRVGYSVQRIGVAESGTIDNVRVFAQRVFNQSTASEAKAEQSIGTVQRSGVLRNSTIFADGAVNRATQDKSEAKQRLGVAE
jgi:hypothetical protein